MKFEEMPRWLTVKQVAEILQISKASAYKSIWKGDIPSTKIGGRRRIDKRKLENLFEENSQGGEK